MTRGWGPAQSTTVDGDDGGSVPPSSTSTSPATTASCHCARISAATDDASLVERLGEPVTIVQGSARAMKITVESDFALADALAALDDAGG